MAKIIYMCRHVLQDELHGKQVRIANKIPPKDPQLDDRKVRCTVCSTIHTISKEKYNA